VRSIHTFTPRPHTVLSAPTLLPLSVPHAAHLCPTTARTPRSPLLRLHAAPLTPRLHCHTRWRRIFFTARTTYAHTGGTRVADYSAAVLLLFTATGFGYAADGCRYHYALHYGRDIIPFSLHHRAPAATTAPLPVCPQRAARATAYLPHIARTCFVACRPTSPPLLHTTPTPPPAYTFACHYRCCGCCNATHLAPPAPPFRLAHGYVTPPPAAAVLRSYTCPLPVTLTAATTEP